MWPVMIDDIVGNEFEIFGTQALEKLGAVGAQILVEHDVLDAMSLHITYEVVVSEWASVAVAAYDPLHRPPKRNPLATRIECSNGKAQDTPPVATTLENPLADRPLRQQRTLDWPAIAPYRGRDH